MEPDYDTSRESPARPRPHERSCTEAIRLRALVNAPDPADPPPTLLTAIAEQIHACCGQSRLKAIRFAYGWTFREAINCEWVTAQAPR